MTGSAIVAGVNTQVIYNNAGAYAGGTNLIWDNTNSRLAVGNTTTTTAPLTLPNALFGDKLRLYGATESNTTRYGVGVAANTWLAYTDGAVGAFSFRRATSVADPTTGIELFGISNIGQVTVSTQTVGTTGAQIRQFSGAHTANLLELTNSTGSTKLSFFGPQGYLKVGGPTPPQCGLDVESGFRLKRTVVSTTPYTILATDCIISSTGPASARAMTLPAASGVGAGQQFTIVDEAASGATFPITIAAAGSDTIDGVATYVLTSNYQAVVIYSDGATKWFSAPKTSGLATDVSKAVILAPTSSTRNVITPTGDYKSLVIKGFAGQTQNMMEVANNANTTMAMIGPQGYVGVGTGATAPISPLDIRGTVNGDVAFSLRPTASATADTMQIYNASAAVASNFDKDGYGFPISYRFALAIGAAATVGTNKTNIMVIERACKIVKCFIVAKTAPTGSALICDIKRGGTSIWATNTANRIQLAATATTGTQTNFDTTTFSEGDQLTIDIAQIGSTIAGQDITVQLLTIAKNQ